MGNLIVRQVQFLLEKMNLGQNSHRQVEGVRRSKRMRETSPLISLSPVCLSPSSLPLSLHPSPYLFLPSLSASLSPFFPAHLSLSFTSLSLSLSSISLSCLFLPSASFFLSLSVLRLSLPGLPMFLPLSPPIGRYLFLHPVSLAYHSSLSVPHLYTPYTTITV